MHAYIHICLHTYIQAYGDEGVPGSVPSNAVIHIEVSIVVRTCACACVRVCMYVIIILCLHECTCMLLYSKEVCLCR